MSRMTSCLANLGLVLCAVLVAGCPGGPVLSVSQTVFVLTNKADTDSFTILNRGGGVLTWSIDAAEVPAWLNVTVSSLVLVGQCQDEAPPGAPVPGPIDAPCWTSPSSVLTGVVGGGVESASLTLKLNDVANDFEEAPPLGEFSIVSNGGTQRIAVALRLVAEGELVVEPLELDFGPVASESAFTVTNGGTEVLSWRIDSIEVDQGAGWLDIVEGSPRENDLTSGTDTVRVSADRTDLEPGDYTGRITVTSDGGEAVVEVAMTVAEPLPPTLAVVPDSLTFETNDEDEAAIAIDNVGAGSLTWTVRDDLPAWLEVAPRSGLTMAEVDLATVSVDAAALAGGVYTHTIAVTSADLNGVDTGSDQVAVTLTVPDPVPELSVSPLSFELGITSPTDFFRIENAGTGQLDWSLTVNDAWLSIEAGDPTAGSVRRDVATIDFVADATMLPPGVTDGTISVTSNGGDATLAIRIDVPPPTLAVVPTVLDFSTNATERLVAIFNSGSGSIDWSIANLGAFPPWMSLASGSPTSGTLSGDETAGVRVRVDRTGLAAGPYAFDSPGMVVADDSAGDPVVPTVAVAVRMVVAERPVISVDTGTDVDGVPHVDLDGVPFLPMGLDETATFGIENIGSGTLNWQIDDAFFPAWLSLDALGPEGVDAGDAPFAVTVTIDREGLVFGPKSHTIFIESNDPDNPRQKVKVEMQVPKVVLIRTKPGQGENEGIDLGTTDSTSVFGVANFGDPGTELDFRVESNKPWLLAFPLQGRSTGVVNPIINQVFEVVNIAIDRTGLEGTGGTGEFTIFAVNAEGKRDDTIAEPKVVKVSARAAELFIESPAARLRVPSLVRFILLMRNLRFESIALPNELLPGFEEDFFLNEDDIPLEGMETEQFLTSADNLKTDIVILLDYSGSMHAAAQLAQSTYEILEDQGQLATFLEADPSTFDGFVDSDDPLQFIYEVCVESLLAELPEHYDVALMEFHDRSQPPRLRTDEGFIRNDAAGRARIVAALRDIRVTDHGATEFTSAILDAMIELLLEINPVPSTDRVVPVTPFDDTDQRGIILISDGRLTTGPVPVGDTALFLRAARVRLFGLAWGDQFNAGPMAALATETGGHVYITVSKDVGLLDQGGKPFLAPSIDTVYDWCNDASADATNLCDLSISKDLKSQVVLSYVTLSVEDSLVSRLSAAFNDPNDGNEEIECRLAEQGSISGELVQELLVAEVVGDVNLGQIALDSAGIAEDGTATVFVYVDYMPRDIVELDLTIGADDAAVAATMQVTRVFSDEGGLFASDWELSLDGVLIAAGVPAIGPGVYTVSAPEPVQYGAFGNLLRLDFTVPDGVPSFRVQVTGVTPSTQSTEIRVFTHADSMLIERIAVLDRLPRAPSFPTPEINPTIVDFGADLNQAQFTIRNVGGSHFARGVALFWEIVGKDTPAFGVTALPFEGLLVGTDEVVPVTLTLDRNVYPPGDRNISILLSYANGVQLESRFIPLILSTFIRPPVLTIASDDFLPVGSTTLNFGTDEDALSFNVLNTGQSTMQWFFTDVNRPDWLFVSPPVSVTQDEPQEVFVSVERTDDTVALGVQTWDLELLATTLDGAVQFGGTSIGSATVTVIVDFGLK